MSAIPAQTTISPLITASTWLSQARAALAAWMGRTEPCEADSAQTRHDAAEHVRALARRVEATQPGFAADLYAAAARHEGYDA